MSKRVTILFSDVVGSSRLYGSYGDAEALRVVGYAMEAMSRAVVQEGGAVLRTLGDEVFATLADARAAIEAACAMHRATRTDDVLVQYGIRLRIGLHFGEVLHEQGEVYGDAVNLAARMARVAEGDQIITTLSTIRALPPSHRARTRSLGTVDVSGMPAPVEIYEVVWQPDTSDLTMLPGTRKEQRDRNSAVLTLRQGGRPFVVTPGQPALTIGRSDQNDVVVDDAMVSRRHAVIDYRQGKFILTDRSANGTYIRIGDAHFFIHREEFPLHGEGVISLGKEGERDSLIYACSY